MSEEKKAIDNFKKLDFFEYDWQIGDDDFETREEMLSYAEKMQKIILNLIEKQQKEIEEKNIAINKMSKDISRQLEEIDEKSTIIMVGAEKVKQLEKEIQRLEKDNDTLSELVIVNEDKVIKELDLISKDKIREKINKLKKNDIEYSETIAILEELLEE